MSQKMTRRGEVRYVVWQFCVSFPLTLQTIWQLRTLDNLRKYRSSVSQFLQYVLRKRRTSGNDKGNTAELLWKVLKTCKITDLKKTRKYSRVIYICSPTRYTKRFNDWVYSALMLALHVSDLTGPSSGAFCTSCICRFGMWQHAYCWTCRVVRWGPKHVELTYVMNKLIH